MDDHSPLKQWLRKHSPVKKNLQKPLPPSPPAGSQRPDWRALSATSGNASPPKAPIVPKATRSKFQNFLRRKPSISVPSSPSPPRQTKRGRFSLSQTTSTVSTRSPIHKTHKRTNSTDLGRLSRKVSILESELHETRKQISGLSRHTSRDSSVEREWRVDEERLKRQGGSLGGEGYSGLVESLLEQTPRYPAFSFPASRSADELSRVLHEDEYDEDRESIERCSPSTQKRKRSELRQTGWEQIQAGLQEERARQEEEQQDQKQNHPFRSVKRTRRAASLDSFSHARNKVLPLSPIKDLSDDVSDIRDEGGLSTAKQKAGTKKRRSSSMDKRLPNPPLDFLHLPPPISASLDSARPSEETQPRKMASGEVVTLEAIVAPENENTANNPPPTKSKKARHHRRQSQVISREEVDEALGVERAERAERTERAEALSSGGEQEPNWETHESDQDSKKLPPSPTRRHCPSPSRLEKVDEEFEWDEEVF